MKKVIVGLSGGVDSSVAALLLLEQGYEVEGLFMRNWDSAANNDKLGNPLIDDPVCPQEIDFQDAQNVADTLGIKLHRHDFVREYWDDVFVYFLAEYKRNRTPNPDILCNKYIKFHAFREVAKQLGADYIAMGHYAQVIKENGIASLLRGLDGNKDQSYFLSQLTQDQLNATLFPIGHLEKPVVRKLALEAKLPTATKKDSTGICFIGERDFQQFLMNYLPAMPGDIVTASGDIVGNHDGLMYYTIGQRKGLGIGGSKTLGNEAWFVIGKELETNHLIVGQGFHHPTLYSNRCRVTGVNWIAPIKFQGALTCTAKFRYRQADVHVVLRWVDETTMEVDYPSLVRAVTPGQAAVFYAGLVCLGGGTIDEVYMNNEKRRY
ncbi:MAG: tRNA 2-thiouridine(34) synthase MnmA [Bacillus subtilis]|nr:tRNA 2-thiouridine(34) synthase MnmA [Bacillus subtilis]